ncbi:hypothetical protein EIP91_011197 [Steccherinum ochraceum]|uniref:Uncharacterized protein n=1 Tax=Steccherinum ochraceum TaxID=92696 RepID=A0A4R0RBP9_9APHY|nr:hypothetical protein EIP91_011197 [Steccherinum ochraceum]
MSFPGSSLPYTQENHRYLVAWVVLCGVSIGLLAAIDVYVTVRMNRRRSPESDPFALPDFEFGVDEPQLPEPAHLRDG